jgi:hypothetical protein
MKKFEKAESFTEFGFVIVRGLLSPHAVKELRSFIQEKMALHGHKKMMFSYQAYKYPELYLLQFEKRAVEMLKQVLGENLCYYPDLSVQYNMFGYPGWHTDSNSEGYAKYLQAQDYKFAKCGIYLQDDTLDWGGGIRLLPKGHKLSLLTGKPKIDLRIRRFLDFCSTKYSFPIKPLSVDTKAGDMLIFDSRLLHASTLPKKIDNLKKVPGENQFLGIPKEHEKIVAYWDASNTKMKNDFLKNATKRSKMEECGSGLFFSGWIQHYFPDDFPSDLVAKAREFGVDIGCLDKQKCQEMRLQFEGKMK